MRRDTTAAKAVAANEVRGGLASLQNSPQCERETDQENPATNPPIENHGSSINTPWHMEDCQMGGQTTNSFARLGHSRAQ